jgi:hypothetical protein
MILFSFPELQALKRIFLCERLQAKAGQHKRLDTTSSFSKIEAASSLCFDHLCKRSNLVYGVIDVYMHISILLPFVSLTNRGIHGTISIKLLICIILVI